MHIDKLLKATYRKPDTSAVHEPMDPAEKLQAGFERRFGRPDPKLYRGVEE